MLNYLTVLVYTETIIHRSQEVASGGHLKNSPLATFTSVNNCYLFKKLTKEVLKFFKGRNKRHIREELIPESLAVLGKKENLKTFFLQ